MTAPAADAHPVDRAAVAATSRSADVPRVPRRRTADPPQPRQDRRRRGLSGSPETPTGSTCPYRALPGPMINLIRDGVSQSELRTGGDRAVFNALVSTATSAQQRGHTYAEWAALISQVRSALGRQARRTSRGKERSPTTYERMLQRAWDTAGAWLETAPPPLTREDIAAQIAAVDAWAADPDAPLTAHERAVLSAACRIAAGHGMTRPALPRRALVQATGLGERAIRTTLDHLDRRGLLRREVPGRPADDPSRRRAGLYRLPDADVRAAAYLYRETRSMGPPGQVCGTPPPVGDGTPTAPVQIYGTPTPPPGTDAEPAAEPAALTVTLQAADPDALPDALAAVLAALRCHPTVVVQPEPAAPARLCVVSEAPDGAAAGPRGSA